MHLGNVFPPNNGIIGCSCRCRTDLRPCWHSSLSICCTLHQRGPFDFLKFLLNEKTLHSVDAVLQKESVTHISGSLFLSALL